MGSVTRQLVVFQVNFFAFLLRKEAISDVNALSHSALLIPWFFEKISEPHDPVLCNGARIAAWQRAWMERGDWSGA